MKATVLRLIWHENGGLEYGVDVVMISKENLNNMSDEIDVINQEINKKADAVVFKPTAEKMTEEKSLNTLIRINKKTPIMVVGDQAGSESFKSLNTVEFDQYSMGAKLHKSFLLTTTEHFQVKNRNLL